MMRKNILVKSLLLLILFSSSWVFIFKPMFATHDFVHGARIAEMSRALGDGHIPPRWSANFGYGYGMPLFSFYAPLPYLVGSVPYLLGASLDTSVKLMIIIGNVIALFGCYLLGKYKWGELFGLVLAALYVLAPYRAVNLFVRGAVSESWGMALLPWIVLGCWLILDRRSKGLLVLSTAVACTFLSHNLTAMIALPSIFFLVVFWWWAEKLQQFTKLGTKVNILMLAKLIGGFLLGAGLASFYVLPSFLEKKYTQLESLIQTGYFDFHHHFLYLRQFVTENWGYGGSAWGPADGFSFFLGFPQIIALSVLSFWLLWQIFRYCKTRSAKRAGSLIVALIFLCFLTIAILLTTPKTTLLWENLPFLSYLQFPWRFLSLISLFIGLLISWWLSFLPKAIYWRFGLILIIASIGFSFRYFKHPSYLTNSDALYYADEGRIRNEMSEILPDYIPKNLIVKQLPKKYGLYVDFSEHEASLSQVLVNRTQEKLYQIYLDESRNIELPIANYPGWQVEVNGQLQSIKSSNRGLIELEAPLSKGESLVGVFWSETLLRQIANCISLLSLVGLIVFTRYAKNPNQ